MVSENANLCLQQTQSMCLHIKICNITSEIKKYLLLFYTFAIKPQLVIKLGEMPVIQKTRHVLNRLNFILIYLDRL